MQNYTNNKRLTAFGPNWEGPYKVVHYSRQGSYHLELMDGKRLPHPWNIEDLKRYHQ